MTAAADRTAIIIGAGIGGLTAAVALAARGWAVRVIERAPHLRPVGYAVIIGPNAQQALATLPGGIVEDIHAGAAIQGDAGIRSGSGAWLSRSDAAIALERYGHPVVALRRSALIAMLASRMPTDALRLGTTVTDIDPARGEVTIGDGEVLRAELLVVADGVGSRTRSILFPGHPEPSFAGLTTWQALVPTDRLTLHAGITWGTGGEFGIYRLADGWAYSFSQAAVDAPMTAQSGADELTELQRRFGDMHAAVRAAIAQIDPDNLLRADIFTMREPLPAFHVGNTAILGDAAHAMAPNLGQGACQAIEDGVTLAYCVSASGTVADGLADYTAARLPRTSLIVRRSEQIARLATARNPLVRALRNGLVRASGLLGPSAPLRQADFVMRWDHPAVSGITTAHRAQEGGR